MKTNKEGLTINVPIIKSTNQFPVVGVGASAGGLSAFKRLLKAIPENSGMAFVLVQHLDPTHKSLLPQLLQKVTNIPVLEIIDEIKVEPDHIYIIPANKMLRANNGSLLLTDRPSKNIAGQNLPIDLFFTSLAEVHQSQAIGVVLSGTASDGTLGLTAIKKKGGLTFAQDEASSTFEGMPQNASMAGVVDFILPPEKIPAKIAEVISYQNGGSDKGIASQDDDILKPVISLLRLLKGTDFTYYKQPTIRRRILRRMVINKREATSGYLKFLHENKREQDILYQDLLIPVTGFFRDQKVFDNLSNTAFSQILKDKPVGDPIRIWVAGCSTGEEVYSIAMCIKEYLNSFMDGNGLNTTRDQKVQIFATDINEQAITKARKGIYAASEVEGLSHQRQQFFFTKTNGGYQVNKSIRDMCVFAIHNFLRDPPFGKINFISCRNVLIYMEPYLQKKALTTFYYALKQKGILLLGKSETVIHSSGHYACADKHDKVFTRKEEPGKINRITSQKAQQGFNNRNAYLQKEKIQADFQKTADEIMLSRYTPAGVVVNDLMDIVKFQGSTGAYLEPSPGRASLNLLKMAKEGIVFELRRILDKAIKDSAVSVKENIQVLINGKHRNIAIEVIPLPNLIEPHYLVLFHEINRIGNNLSANSNKKISSLKIKRDQKDLRIHQLEEELMQTREDMRIIAKAQEAATEELQSANEELVSGSEELQSLNEELETSKEELLSTNEELMVVSQEMVSLNEQVSEARDYTEAIIDTIREPLLVLDNNLRVKSANKTFYKTFRVNEHETEGVLVYDLGNKQWNIPSLKKLLEEILPQNTKFTDFEVTHEFPIIGERIMLLNACEMVTENKSGKLILLALEDITERKIAERKVEESELFYRSVLESSPDCIKILDAGGRLQFMNTNGICLMEIDDFNLVKNKYWWDLWEKGNQQLVKDAVTKALNGEKVKFQAFRPTSKDSPKWWDIIVSPIYDTDKANPPRILSVSRDITEQKQHEVKKQELLGRFQNLVKHAPVAICVLRGENYVIEVINERMLEMWDTKAEDALNKTAFEVLPELIDLGFKDLLDTVFYKGERIVAEEIPIDLKRRGKIEHAFVNFVYEPLRDEDGTISGVMALAHEITEQVRAKNQNMEMHQVRAKELEEKVQQRTLELSSANEELQQKNQEVALSKYNKRFLTEFSDKFSAHEVHNEFFNSLVQFIADTTHLDYIFVGKLEQNEQDEFIIQTIAVNAFGKLSENFNYPLPDGPCEQVIGGTIYSYPRQCRKIFPKNKTIEQFNVEGYIGFPLHDEKGDPVGLIAVMHQQEISDDETVSAVMKIVARRAELELERIKFEEQLLQNNKSLAEKNDELEKINKELQAFTYVSSHDLQEPLRKIKTFASLLHDQEDQNLSNRGKDYLNRVQQAANRMQSLIEDLLDYSHINITERKFENTDITKIIEDVKNELAENILEKNAIIEVVNVCQVKIIPFQFRQLMHNLIGNALKFSRSGISPQIVIKGETVKGGKIPHEKLVAEKDYCHISISDNGIGFDPQYKNRIFEIFQRLYSKNEYEGTGIGLAIVKKIVENHNGVITATSELGKGATFDIYIPHNEKNSN